MYIRSDTKALASFKAAVTRVSVTSPTNNYNMLSSHIMPFVLLAPRLAAAFGINCQGSFKCGEQPSDTSRLLVECINTIDSGWMYPNGRHICCRLNVCAFLQGESEARSGGDIKGLAPKIVEHGCKSCGSVPTRPGNNVAYGELTFNYVSDTWGARACANISRVCVYLRKHEL
ncbi:Killer toxin, Kp4/SMK-like, core [Mycena kentingensis (nom. inval.)]|nr:Killer toxin, Kp4/SMK-like, core [Mycena kentingensis (nom. inval.)]